MAYLIQVTGTSATGKSTVVPLVAERITQKGYEVRRVIEPGPLRDFIKEYRRKHNNPWEEAALFTADRIMNYGALGFPTQESLEHARSDLVLLTDRSFLDTLVYQGMRGGVDQRLIWKQHKTLPRPDLALCLTVDGEEGYKRITERFSNGGETTTRTESVKAINELSNFYGLLRENYPGLKLELIDTTDLDLRQVTDACYEKIRGVLPGT